MKFELESQDPQAKRRLTDDEFIFIYSRVPCLCADIVIVENGGVLFAKREIEPFMGYWTLPGGIVRYKETIDEAFDRLIKNELGVKCVLKKLIGYCQTLNDGPWRSSLSLVFLTEYEGQLCGSDQGHEFKFISDFSENVHPYHSEFFKRNWTSIIS